MEKGSIQMSQAQDFSKCDQALQLWVDVNAAACNIHYPITDYAIQAYRQELVQSCTRDECASGRKDALAKIKAACPKDYEGLVESSSELVWLASNDLLSYSQVDSTSPECTIRNKYCVIEFYNQFRSGCLSDSKKCSPEEESMYLCNRCFHDLYQSYQLKDNNAFSFRTLSNDMIQAKDGKLGNMCGGFDSFVSSEFKYVPLGAASLHSSPVNNAMENDSESDEQEQENAASFVGAKQMMAATLVSLAAFAFF